MRIPQLVLITTLAFGLGAARGAEPVLLADASDWTKIGGSDRFALLVNPPSIERGKKTGKAWLMYDFFDATTNDYGQFTFRSFKVLEYFHCKQRTASMKSAVFYTASMGEGDVVKSITHEDREMKFHKWDTGSAEAGAAELVCTAAPAQKS